MLIFSLPFALTVALAVPQAQKPGAESLFGDWREPAGSIIETYRCGADVCLKLVAISKDAPAQVDHHNPDAALRSRPLCGLQIGFGFHPTDATHADGGKLYDPKAGKTYSGAMYVEGDQLHLRGYIGMKAFGRSETWPRVAAPTTTCAKQ